MRKNKLRAFFVCFHEVAMLQNVSQKCKFSCGLQEIQGKFSPTHNAFKANTTPKLSGRVILNKILCDLENRKLIAEV